MRKIWSLIMIAFWSVLFQCATARLPSAQPFNMFPDTTHILARFDERDLVKSFGSDEEHRGFQLDMLLSAYYLLKLKELHFKVSERPNLDSVLEEINRFRVILNALRHQGIPSHTNQRDLNIQQEYGLPQVEDEEMTDMITNIDKLDLPPSFPQLENKLRFLMLNAMHPANWRSNDYRAFVPTIFYNIWKKELRMGDQEPTTEMIDLLLGHENMRAYSGNMFTPRGINTVFSFIKQGQEPPKFDGESSSSSWD